ncbi:MAG: FecR family protein, partial [Desulfobacterales bacterium]|nr:FecR family protein [Desulfobacterales bacterium]
MKFRLSGIVAAIILLAAAGLVHAGDLTISKTGEQEVMVIGEKTSYAKRGDTVSEGDEIVIVGKGTVRLESENRIVVMDAHKGSILNYEKTDPDGTIEMGIKKGVVDFKVVPGNKFDVTTPHMVAAVRGTRFTLDVDDFETALMVEKGSVQANDNKGKSMPVGAGQAIRATEQA